MNLKGIDALNKASKLMESLIVSEKRDSFSNVEKTYNAANGKTYGIVKEGAKYVIKEGQTSKAYLPEHFEYIQGVQNKSKYSKETILEAEKTLHLWNIEFQRIHGNKFLREQEEEGKKMVLKVPGAKAPAAPAEMPEMPADAVPADATPAAMPEMPEGGEEAMPPMPEEDAEAAEMPEAGAKDMPEMPEEGEEESEEGDDEDPVKLIQKLAGKLAYELREFQGEDEEYGDLANFALGMVASAVNPEKLSTSDIKKLKKKVDKNLKKDSGELDLDYPGSEEDMPEEDEDMPEDEGADGMPEGDEEGSDEGQDIPEGDDEDIEKTLAEIFKKIKESDKKLSDKQHKLDKNKNGKLDAEDFKMLRNSKNEGAEMPINEKLQGKPIEVWIKDFINSKDPKFKGKSKAERMEMAKGAFYADKKKNSSSKKKKSLKEFKDYGLEEGDDSDIYFEEKTDNLLLDIDPLNEYSDLYEDDYLSEEEMGLMEMGNLYEDDYLSEESYSDSMDEEDLFSEEAYLREFNKLHEEDYLMSEDDYIFELDTDEEVEDYFQESFKKKVK